MTKRVAVALSGGVDSAVCAALLKNEGYAVIGLTGKMTNSEDSDTVIKNAKRVADKLGIEHYVFDTTEVFNNKIIKYFEESYSNGKTPNPCIMCNKYIKWGVLFDYATKVLNADFIATGHYAEIKNCDGIFKLYPATDETKDQLYFLYKLNQEHLAKTLFPLAKYKKSEVKAIAEKYDLPPKSSKESQDICFIKPPMTTKKYLESKLEVCKGDFIEQISGKTLGYHNGFWQYTIGQRKGIGIAAPEPLYVTGINSATNTVFVGYKETLFTKEFNLSQIEWNYPQTSEDFEAFVKIRYNMHAVKAQVKKIDSTWNISFCEPVSALTPGQACVLYDINDGHLLGGSIYSP